MSEMYRIYGMELSPYSVKVRSYFRYKKIPHEWIVRNVSNMDEFNRHAKLPLVPLVVAPDGTAMQDSTPIIESMETRFPEPALQPADPALAFISALIEEYADEWATSRCSTTAGSTRRTRSRRPTGSRRAMNPDLDEAGFASTKEAVKGRMVPRLALVGSSAVTKDVIEASFHRQLAILEAHLAARPFLFGGRPALGDLGLFAQLYECSTDPTPGAIMRERAPRTLAWIERMLDPDASGAFEPWDRLEATLQPLLRDEIGAILLPVDAREHRRDSGGREGRVHARRQALRAGAPEVPREVAAPAA